MERLTLVDGEFAPWAHKRDILEKLKAYENAEENGQVVGLAFWEKQMEENKTATYTSYTPRWRCSNCKMEIDPAFAYMVKYCFSCGSKIQ